MLSESIHIFLNSFRKVLLLLAESLTDFENAYRSRFVEGTLEIFLALDL